MALWVDDELGLAGGGPEGAADEFDAFDNAGGPVAERVALGGEFVDGAGAGDVVAVAAGGIAADGEGGGPEIAQGAEMLAEDHAGLEVFVEDADLAADDLDEQGGERVAVAEVEGPVDG